MERRGPRVEVISRGLAIDALRVGVQRVGLGMDERLLGVRNRYFSVAVRDYADKRQPFDVVVLQYSGALSVLERSSRDAVRVLNLPMAHPGYVLEAAAALGLDRHAGWARRLELAELVSSEIRLADYVLVPSQFAARTMLDNGVCAKKVLVLPLGADGLPRPDRDKTKSAPGSRIRVVFVGGASAEKGARLVVAAAKAMPDTDFVLAGSRALTSPESVYPPNVKFVGFLSRESLADLYEDSDLFVAPTYHDGFGLALIEAMKFGIACMSSTRSIAPEVIDHGRSGFLLEELSAERLIHDLRGALSDRVLLKEIGLEGQRVASAYSWDRYRHDSAGTLVRLLGSQA